jgi:glyoxylase-like metal-dependent hydrolase (beta-lactamase superfamily II)
VKHCLLSYDDLRGKLTLLDDERAVAKRELIALSERQQRLVELEHDRDTLMEHYAGMVPEASRSLSPEERHQLYRMLRLKVVSNLDRCLQVTGAIGNEFLHSESVSKTARGEIMAQNSLDVGNVKVHVLDDGTFTTDAGNLFGPNAKRAKIRGAMHSALVETGDNLVLLDAGFGPELPEVLEGRYELDREENLMDSLREAGYDPEDVTHVVLSHLDPDHVGWAINPPSFPNATVYVQEDALEEAREMSEGDGRREAVPAVEKGIEEGWCELLSGNTEIVEGLRVEVRSGHAEGHQISWIESDDKAALFTADLAPAKIWLNPDLISGVDTDPEAARKNRIEVLTEAEEREAPVILYHEPRDFLVKIRKTDGGFEGESWEGNS